MELKEAITQVRKSFPGIKEYEALQMLIEYAETLLKVQELGGVKKKEEWETCTFCGGIGFTPNLPHHESHLCGRCNGNRKIERKDYKLYNQALDLKDAELSGKLEGLESFLWTRFPDLQELTKTITQAIRSHILGTGKKEE